MGSGNGGQVSLDATLDGTAQAIGLPLAKSQGGHALAPEGLQVVVEVRHARGGLIARGRWPTDGPALLERATATEDAAVLADRALAGALVHLAEWYRLLTEADSSVALSRGGPRDLVERVGLLVREARTAITHARGDEG